jgi:hypothetical protein
MYQCCLSRGYTTNVDGGVCSQAGTCDILPLQDVPLCCESNTDWTCSGDATVSSTFGLWLYFNYCVGADPHSPSITSSLPRRAARPDASRGEARPIQRLTAPPCGRNLPLIYYQPSRGNPSNIEGSALVTAGAGAPNISRLHQKGYSTMKRLLMGASSCPPR